MVEVFVGIVGNQQLLTFFFLKEIISSITLINDEYCDSKRRE